MSWVGQVSAWILPAFVGLVLILGAARKVPLLETFVKGAKEGLAVAVDMAPTLVAMLVAVGMLRASGALEALAELLAGPLGAVGVPGELAPLAVVKLFSGSAATGMLTDLYAQAGPDSYLARAASALVGASETIFYLIPLYFGVAGVKKGRWTLPVALVSFAAAVVCAVWITRVC
ncbi:MAG: nucleoside recognition domain-containing protein [Christensenellales bacterium]